ncbi:MAG: VWA domain-containing protein [Rhodocyclaceae bacterium]|nr:VWA domain-containing protein [Rhodocyclaceae bacterium]
MTTRGLPLLLACGLLALALAMPPLSWSRRSYDFLAVFDITQSMGVADYRLDGRPASRLDFARQALREALPRLPCGSRVGLAAFTEYRSLMLLAPIEVCEHYNDLLATLEQLDGRMRWADASQVSKGVYWALRAARDIGDEPRLLFFSDGHESPPIEGEGPALFGDITRGQIGGLIVGTGDLAPSPIPKVDPSGRSRGVWSADEVAQGLDPDRRSEHLSGLRETHLQGLAARTGLGYVRLEDAAGLTAAMRDPQLARTRELPTDLTWMPVALALAAVCWPALAGVLRARRNRLPATTDGAIRNRAKTSQSHHP